MLKEQRLGQTLFNNLKKEYYSDIPQMPDQVRVRLHPSKFKVKRSDVVTSTDPNAKVQEISIKPLIGETQIVLCSNIWVDEVNDLGHEVNEQKNIAVIDGGAPYLLTFPKNEGEVVLLKKNGLHQQIYYFFMVWDQCKNSINGDDKNFYCEMIDDSARLDLSIQKDEKQTDAKVLIKECNDLDVLFNIAGTVGYNGDKTTNQIKAFLNALAATDPKGIIAAFASPDTIKLRMSIVNGFNEGVLQYKPKNGKIGIAGDAGRDFVSSDQNEDFNSRVSKLLVYFGLKGNEDDLIYLNSALEKKALKPLEDLLDEKKPKKAALPKESSTINVVNDSMVPLIPEL